MNGHVGRQAARESVSGANVIEIALRLASNDAVKSVHVVSSERPTYRELLHVRRQASARDLNLAVTGSSLSLKRRLPPVEAGLEERPVGALHTWAERLREQARTREATPNDAATIFSADDSSRSTTLRRWLDVHGQAWRASLAGLNEGTR